VEESSDGVLDAPSAEPDAEFEDHTPQPVAQPIDSSRRTAGVVQPFPADPPSDSASTELVPGPTTDDALADDWGSEASAIAELTAAVRGVEQQAQSFHARAEKYEHVIRQMQSRIEQLQGDQVQALLKPVIQRFAGLHAQAVDASEQARSRGESAEKNFDFFAVAIEEALGLVDIESVAAAPSIEFDPSKHHASRSVATDDASLDGRIQRVLRQGFTYAGAARVFLPAQVSIYRYEQPPETDAAEGDQEQDQANEPGEGASGD
jgi:molecular chaperone GrpE (heat shock protein)